MMLRKQKRIFSLTVAQSAAIFLLSAGCKPPATQIATTNNAADSNGFETQKAAIDKLLKILSSMQKNIAWHVNQITRNSPYLSFAPQTQLGLIGADSAESVDLLSMLADPTVEPIAVPETEQQLVAFNQRNSNDSAFALSGNSLRQSAQNAASAIKGLHSYMLCNSPATGLYAFANTDKIPVLGFFERLANFAVNVPSPLKNAAFFAAPWLKDPSRGAILEVFGGIALKGPDAGFGASLYGGKLWKAGMRSNGVEASVQTGKLNTGKMEVFGLPAGPLPNVATAASWMGDEIAISLYQDLEVSQVGVRIKFSIEKILQMGEIDAWKKGRVCNKPSTP